MKIGRNDPCWCGCGKKYKQCHEQFDRKIESMRLNGCKVPKHNQIKNPQQIEAIREAAKINITVLDEVSKIIKPGICAKEIDDLVYKITTEMGAVPAPLNYEGFPYSVCTSINDQVCHGFPAEDVILKDGDIVNVDCTTNLNGYYADSSRMFMIGDVDPETQKLVRVAKECCDLGLAEVKPWGFLGDVGATISAHAHANGYQVVREIGGHGVGCDFHEEPWIGYNTLKGTELVMAPGFMFTIEPMVNMGSQKIYTDKENDWEVYTLDGKPSAQWEYQILVTEDGYEVISY